MNVSYKLVDILGHFFSYITYVQANAEFETSNIEIRLDMLQKLKRKKKFKQGSNTEKQNQKFMT